MRGSTPCSARGHRDGLRTARGRRRRVAALDAPARRGAMTFALPGARRLVRRSRRTDDPFIHQEMIEILYHTLWETVHVFFEHRELGHDVGAAGIPLSVSRPPETGHERCGRRGGRVDPDQGGRRRGAARAGCQRGIRPHRRRGARDQRAHSPRRQAAPVRQRRVGDRRQRLGDRLRAPARRLPADSGVSLSLGAGHAHRDRQRCRASTSSSCAS